MKEHSKRTNKDHRLRSHQNLQEDPKDDELQSFDRKFAGAQRSEAEKRNDLEEQRKRHHDTAEHDAQTNNRFLHALAEQSKLLDEGKRTHEADDNSDNDDSNTTATLLAKRNMTSRTRFINDASIEPYWNWHQKSQTSVPATKRWSEQLKQQEAAGLFVEEEKEHFRRIKKSTLDRLEERLSRELPVAPLRSLITTGAELELQDHRELLIKRLLVPNTQQDVSLSSHLLAVDDVTNDAVILPTAIKSQGGHGSDKKTPDLAILELFIDRVVLDDHHTFVLADRLAAQLRALYTAYSRMQQLQPWQLCLQRVTEYFSSYTSTLAESGAFIRANLSTHQVVEEVNRLLTHLEALSQLHQQILGKANEMNDAEICTGSVLPFRVKQLRRKQPIELSHADAVLELLESKFHMNIEEVAQRLSSVSTTSAQAMQHVLQLESVIDRDSPRDDVLWWSSRFYVVLQINGKSACTTNSQALSRGEVCFSEKMRLTLPFFPSSVCAQVYERRSLLRDDLLSTNAIPVIVPGHDVVKPAPFRLRSLLFDKWGENDIDQLVPAASLVASDEWYQFSCEAPIARTRWHRSFYNAPLFVHTSRRTQGRLHLRASWTSSMTTLDSQLRCPSSNSLAYLPPRRPETAGGSQTSSFSVQLIGKSHKNKSTHLSQYLCDSSFSNERDFLRLVEPHNLPLDPNDPENAAVRRLQVYYMQQQHEAKSVSLGRRKVFRTSDVSGPLTGNGCGLTKRNRLLQLRDREFASRHGTSFCDAITSHDSEKVEPSRWIPQHAVFDEPLPLLEHELVANERLLRLLRPELHAFDRRLLFEEAERADASIVDQHRLRQLVKLQDFRERVRQTQIVSDYNADNNKHNTRTGRSKPLSAIVQEKALPLFPGTLELPAIGALFAPRRRLRPRSKVPLATSSAQAAAHWPTSCTLYVQVQKAVNVPVRIKQSRNETEAEEIEKRRRTLHRSAKSPRVMVLPLVSDNQSEELVETPREGIRLEYESNVFVRISFQDKTRQTSCAAIMGSTDKTDDGVGAHPMWMETVAFPFCPPQDDWSPNGIASTQDTIRFSLFDQVTRPTLATRSSEGLEEERLGAQTRALHRENCFLGSLEVPFLTLYHAGYMESMLRCEMPVEHLGYVNLQAGATHGPTSSIVYTSIGPPSDVSSSSEVESPRQRRQRGVSRGDSTSVRVRQPKSPRSPHTPRSPRSPRSPQSPRSLQSPRSPRSAESSGFGDAEDADDDADKLGVKQAAREATYLKVKLLLDPSLPVADSAPDQDKKDGHVFSPYSAQDKLLHAHAQRWAAHARNIAPTSAARHRNYNAFVRNLSHGATFLPRFLRAQSPPFELQAASVSSLVRYVSLIPFLDDWLVFDGNKDVWSTTQEFLDMGAGDHEEHAVLLANYFMWYDRRHRDKDENVESSRIYLVLGQAVPEGRIVYVLRRGVLWNASTGIGYSISDPHCPLYDVSLVVSCVNVFANVQPSVGIGRLHELNWKIESNAKYWKPFFTGEQMSLPPTVQRREPSYTKTCPSFVEQVERELREALKLAVRRWRSTHFVTHFNEAAGLQLREHLMVLEREANGLNSNSSADGDEQSSLQLIKRVKQKLKLALPTRRMPTRRMHPGSSVLRELQRSREIYGIPFHVSFTDISRVLEVVKNTNIHYNERPGVEFALAVYVSGHPNCVLSVWIYLAALAPL